MVQLALKSWKIWIYHSCLVLGAFQLNHTKCDSIPETSDMISGRPENITNVTVMFPGINDYVTASERCQLKTQNMYVPEAIV